jgi:type I restriction enzyme S subunit
VTEFPVVQINGYANVQSGYSFKSSDWLDDGVPVVKIANVKDGRVDRTGLGFVSETVAAQAAKFSLSEGDVLLAMTGYVGEMAVVKESDLPLLLNQRVGRCLPVSPLLDKRFMYYALSSSNGRLQLENLGQGSAQANLSAGDFGLVEIPLPPLAEQRAIAGVLGALDDKIESNLRTWRLSTELVRSEYELLVSEESGSSCRMRDICDFNLRTRKPGSPGEAIRYIDISSVEAGVVTGESETTWADAPSRARRSVTDGDLIFSTVRPARMAYSMMIDPDSSTVVSTGFAVMSPKGVPSTLLFAIVSDAEFGKYCESVSQGSAYPAVSPDSMGNYEVQLPEKDVLSTFGVWTEAILRRAHQGMQENRALASLRDALLPELLSGRLRVRDAESMMENV